MLTENAEDFDIVMSMYNLLEYSENYSMTSRSVWNNYKDKIDDVGDNFLNGKLSKYKTNTVEKTPERQERVKRSPQP